MRVGVVGRDDLTLLGELEPPVDRSGRLAQDRAVRRAATAADGAATAVEQRQFDAQPARGDGQVALRPVEHPARGQEPRFLVRVGVAQHHLLAVAAGLEVVAVARLDEECLEDRPRGRERIRRLEERHDVERRDRLAGEPREVEHVRHVPRGGGEADHVAVRRRLAEPRLGLPDGPEGGEHLVQ